MFRILLDICDETFAGSKYATVGRVKGVLDPLGNLAQSQQ